MITAYSYGHKIYYDQRAGQWLHMDGTPSHTIRPCPKCGKLPTALGHDACIANIPGVEEACCGHGVEPGYALFTNGRILNNVWDVNVIIYYALLDLIYDRMKEAADKGRKKFNTIIISEQNRTLLERALTQHIMADFEAPDQWKIFGMVIKWSPYYDRFDVAMGWTD